MKKTKRSAFTIVELVIVIAVIAILSAVLIPTFGTAIKSANIASDQTAASSLTSELHVHLKGDQIETEEELVTALAASGISSKLNPKAEQYGYHYWFDKENQMIVAERSDVVAAKAEALKNENGNTGSNEPNGPALMSEVLTNDVTSDSSVNISFRDIYGIGWYLIDDDTTLGNVVKTLTNKDTDTAKFTENVLNVLKAYEIEDDLHTALVTTINTTIIVTDHATFTSTTATQVAFADGVTMITSNTQIVNTESATLTKTSENLPLESGTVVIPDSVTCIADDSFNFTATEGSVNVNVEISEDKLGAFCPNSTNATINTDLAITEKTDDEGNTVQQIVDTTTNEVKVKELVSIKGRFPYYDFKVAQENAADKSYEWYNNNLYISYYAFAGKTEADTLQLKVTDGEKDAFVADAAHVAWAIESTDCNLQISDADVLSANGTITGSAKVTATVTLINGSEGKATFNVYVVKPESTEVSIGANDYAVPYTNGVGTQSFNWNYDGTNDSMTVSLGDLTYVGNCAFANTTPNLELVYDTDVFTYANGKLTLNVADGKLVAATKKNADGTTKDEYDIVITVDGCITSTVTAIVRDCTDVPLVANFNQAHTTNYYRYIGNGNINLGSLMKLKDSTVLPYDSTINIEAYFSNNWWPITSVRQFGLTCSGTSVTPIYNEDGTCITSWEFDGADWEDVIINLSKGDTTLPIRIKITPQTASETDANTITLELKYVNATNVVGIDDLIDKVDTESVVLFGDINDVSNSDKIVVGTGVTLYGNGFKINATTYKAEATGTTSNMTNYSYGKEKRCTQSGCGNNGTGYVDGTCYSNNPFNGLFYSRHSYEEVVIETKSSGTSYSAFHTNQALITLAGGIIDNIYIDGPVYPTLQYYMDDSYSNSTSDVSTAYYVSGIKVTTTGTIKNSYVSGFRQPVSAQGSSLSVDNTTLEGGNYANLQLVTGTLNLNDVITVQDPDGMESTVDTIGTLVIGLGVVVESGALQSTINITGYLNQYNWVPENTDATLPTISGIDLDEIFGYAFNGFSGIKISRFLVHLHEDTSGMQYMNAGFIFANIGGTEEIEALSDFKRPVESNRNLVSDKGFNTGSVSGDASVTTGTSLSKIVVRLTEVSGNSIVDGIISGMFENTDGLVYIYSYVDGRVWDYSDDTVDEDASALKDVVVLSDEEGSVHPITYKGYYTNYGN